MDKLKNLSKVMDILIKLVLLYVAVQFILVFVNLDISKPAVFLENWGADTFNISYIDIGTFQLEFRNEQTIAMKYLTIDTILSLLAFVMSFVAIVFLACMFGKLLKPMKQGQPFDGTVSRTLKKLGVGCILIGIMINIISYIQFRNTHSAFFEIVEKSLFLQIEGIKSEFSIELGYLFVGIMILIFSFVFRYGEELQVQADETL